MDKAKTKRLESEADKLKLRMFLMVKWSILKDKKQEFSEEILKRIVFRNFCSLWIKQILKHYCLKIVADAFSSRKEQHRMLWRQKHRRNKIVRFIRKRLECKSLDETKRLLSNVKYASTYRAVSAIGTADERAKKVLLNFLKASALIEEMRAKLGEFP